MDAIVDDLFPLALARCRALTLHRVFTRKSIYFYTRHTRSLTHAYKSTEYFEMLDSIHKALFSLLHGCECVFMRTRLYVVRITFLLYILIMTLMHRHISEGKNRGLHLERERTIVSLRWLSFSLAR